LSTIGNLLDANVWLALAVDVHTHHAAATRHWPELHRGGIAFNRVTQTTLLRLLTNPKVMGSGALSNAQAWAEVGQAFDLADAKDTEEPANFAEKWIAFAKAQRPARDLWTDSYLAAFAFCAQLRLVTFDRGFKRFKNLETLILGDE
jgi:uncharacterized protein